MNMAIMDVSTLEPLVQALPKLLKSDGVYVSLVLSCFETKADSLWTDFSI